MQIPSFRPGTATEINLGRVDGWPSNRGVARHEPPHRAARVVSSPRAWYAVTTQISLSPEMVGGPVVGGRVRRQPTPRRRRVIHPVLAI